MTVTKTLRSVFSSKQIDLVEVGSFQGLTSLWRLFIQINYGTFVLRAGLFSDCHSLDNIAIQRNEIETIEPNSLQALTSLTAINFYTNKLRVVHPHMFANITTLRSLILRYNRLTTILPNSFQGRLKKKRNFPPRTEPVFPLL